jgi:large subunit ribosomal protein L25
MTFLRFVENRKETEKMDMILNAQTRQNGENTKSIRKGGMVPAVVYGKNQESTEIKIPLTSVKKFFHQHPTRFHLVIGKNKYMATLKEVQKNPVDGQYIHLSFYAFNASDVVTFKVPLNLTGTAQGYLNGGIINHQLHTLEVQGKLSDIPETFTVDISSLAIGESLHLSETNLFRQYPQLKFRDQGERVVVNCQYKKLEDIKTAAATETETATTELNKAA